MTIDEAYEIVRNCEPRIRGAFAIWIRTSGERFFVRECDCRILAILDDDLRNGRLERVER